ncbi:hypothetical protein Scep_001944 [Stephania cephalantha]|uniref:Uncharacterized protein n=1 Tax=Stephania cephalantha TaxID=152367 RepID=A0AAP0L947_9MAGN
MISVAEDSDDDDEDQEVPFLNSDYLRLYVKILVGMARGLPDRILTDGDLDGRLRRHIPIISPTGLSSSNHTPSSHSNHFASLSRLDIPSLTISAPLSTASPAPSGGSHEAMRALECLEGVMELPRRLLSNPLLPAPSATPQEGGGGTPHIALNEDEDDKVTPNDVFLHVHTKDHDGVTFIDSRSSRFYVTVKLVRRREQHTQDTPDQSIDEEQLYYDAAEECPKGRVYGLGSLAKRNRRYDPGASTSRELMVRSSELDVVVQRLAQFEAYVQSQLGIRMEFGASTSQAPPPPPHQEHHQHLGMDSACSP